MAADTTTDAPTDGEVTEYLIKISKHNELNRLMICGIIHTKVSRIQVVDWNEFISKGLVDEQELVDIFLLLIGSSVKSVIFHIELNDVKIEELFKKLRESGIFVGYRIGYGYNNEEEIEQCGLDYLEFKHLPEIGRCLTVTAIKFDNPHYADEDVEKQCRIIDNLPNLEVVTLDYQHGFYDDQKSRSVNKLCNYLFKRSLRILVLHVNPKVPIYEKYIRKSSSNEMVIVNDKIIVQRIPSLREMIVNLLEKNGTLDQLTVNPVGRPELERHQVRKFQDYLINKRKIDEMN